MWQLPLRPQHLMESHQLLYQVAFAGNCSCNLHLALLYAVSRESHVSLNMQDVREAWISE